MNELVAIQGLCIFECFLARNSNAWCIVGTPENQVIFFSTAMSRKPRALKPGRQHTDAPFEMLVASTAINP